MNFYLELEKALFSADINTKELIVDRAIEYCQDFSVTFKEHTPIIPTKPSYSKICKIVEPKELPKRGDFSRLKGQIALVHSIAHIEFSAIDLAIDAAYRFTNMPREYKLDWLIVAQDEIRHFKMLKRLLEKLGSFYGDLPVHKGLFDASINSKDSVLDRMAVIPRYFEASGLDVNPKLINRLKSFKKSEITLELIEALGIIYQEEIDHVYKGDKWFKYLCNIEGSDYRVRYLDILERYNLRGRASQFDIEGRKKAGFSCEELIELGAKECK